MKLLTYLSWFVAYRIPFSFLWGNPLVLFSPSQCWLLLLRDFSFPLLFFVTASGERSRLLTYPLEGAGWVAFWLLLPLEILETTCVLSLGSFSSVSWFLWQFSSLRNLVGCLFNDYQNIKGFFSDLFYPIKIIIICHIYNLIFVLSLLIFEKF